MAGSLSVEETPPPLFSETQRKVLDIDGDREGEICSEEEFSAALERQNAKQDVQWYELTPENIELAMAVP